MSIPKDKLIDEDTLLREEDRAWSGPASNCDSTLKTANATNKPKPARRACKNCSCGLAETKTEPDSASPIITSAAKSSCGNCYLGDAFRCGGCPYRGIPAFKPGEQVEIPNSFLADDS